MRTRQFYVPRDSIRGNSVTLPSNQAHHLRDVLRMSSGEVVEIFDGTGQAYAGKVELQGPTVIVRDLQTIPARDSVTRVLLAAALIKSSKFEWVLQKAAELGVNALIPLRTRRTEIRIPESKIASRLERWDRIVQEASKQCRRLRVPQIFAPMGFSELLAAEEFSPGKKLLFHADATETWKWDPDARDSQILLCIGPEGGWEDGEIADASRAGYQIFSLGPLVLRAETASIATAAITRYHINLRNSQD